MNGRRKETLMTDDAGMNEACDWVSLKAEAASGAYAEDDGIYPEFLDVPGAFGNDDLEEVFCEELPEGLVDAYACASEPELWGKSGAKPVSIDVSGGFVGAVLQTETKESESTLAEQSLGVRITPPEDPREPLNAFDVRTAPLCRPTLLEASAGTGKTFSIKHLVLRLIVERNMRIDQILVVTFTKDATAELSMRIREHLTAAARMLEGGASGGVEIDPLVGDQIDLWRAWGLEPEEALRRIRASLTRFDDAAIFTIHGFCQKMLSSRAFSAGTPFGFEKATEDVLSDIRSEIVEDFLRRALDAESSPERRRALLGIDWEEILVGCSPYPEALVPRRVEADGLDDEQAALVQAFVKEAPQAYLRAKAERRVFDFDDLLSNLWRTLEEQARENKLSSVPFARVLRSAYTAVMIDEFQDTDPVQFDIMRRLFMEGLSARELSERALFFVGDPKQAIYSFRGADLNTYLEARKEIEAVGRRMRLGRNYRSTKPLVEAVNDFFSTKKGEGPFLRRELVYEAVEAGSDRPGLCRLAEDGTVTVDPPFEYWLAKRPYALAEEMRAATGEAVARDIVALLQAGRRGEAFVPCTESPEPDGARDLAVNGRVSRMRPVEARDIAVLVRKRDHADDLMMSFARWGVRFSLKSEEDVMATREASEMALLLEALRRPGDVCAVNGARTTRLWGETLAGINAADEGARVAARSLLEDALKLWPRGGAAAVIRHIMRERRTVERLLPKMGGERILTNYEHLTELIHAASRTHRTASSLCAWFAAEASRPSSDERKLRQESEDNVVSIVTIHSSKGLEYPIVYLPRGEAMGCGTGSHKRSVYRRHENGRLFLEIHPLPVSAPDEVKRSELEELARLAYVAATRAAAKLVLVVPQRARSAKASEDWYKPYAHNAYHAVLLGGLGKDWTGADREAVMQRLNDMSRLKIRDIDELAARAASPLGTENDVPALQADPGGDVRVRWVTSSYTALARTIEDGDFSSKSRLKLEPDGTILCFGRGPRYGDALHRVMEAADFALMARADEEAEAARRRLCRTVFDVTLPERGREALLNEAAGADMLRRVLSSELLPGLRLADIAPNERVAEMAFLITVHPSISVDQFSKLLERLGRASGRDYGVGTFEPRMLAGFLTGSIDLVVRAKDGRFWVIDWKSNALGTKHADYGQAVMAEALREHHYRLQYLLYLVALRRFLKSRLGERFHGELIAGAAYVFVRGITHDPLVDGVRTGVIVDAVPPVVVETIDELLAGGWDEARVIRAERELKESVQ